MKRLFIYILLAFLVFWPYSHALSFSECCDTIKKSVVFRLPEKWQKLADEYFWPGVGVCAAAITIAVYHYTRESRNPQEIFTDFLYELRDAEPPVSRKLVEGDYSVAMLTIDEPYWNNVWAVTAATVHLEYKSKQLCSCMLSVPFASLDNPSVREIVDIAMQRLAERLALENG